MPAPSRAFHGLLEVARRAIVELSLALVVEGCPAWCNAHQLEYGQDSDGDLNLHRHVIEGDGWRVRSLRAKGSTAGSVSFVDELGQEVPLRQSRAYAMALLGACDAVEATR